MHVHAWIYQNIDISRMLRCWMQNGQSFGEGLSTYLCLRLPCPLLYVNEPYVGLGLNAFVLHAQNRSASTSILDELLTATKPSTAQHRDSLKPHPFRRGQIRRHPVTPRQAKAYTKAHNHTQADEGIYESIQSHPCIWGQIHVRKYITTFRHIRKHNPEQ